MKASTAKAKAVGPIAGLPLRLAGSRDGKKGLPKPSEAGDWQSPVMEKYNKAFAQRQDEEYRLCAEKTKALQIEADALSRDIRRNEALQTQLDAQLAASAPEEAALAVRHNGEEALPESGIRARRLREHDRQWAEIRARRAAAERFLHDAYSRLAAILAEITEAETDTRLRVERVRANTDARILIYYHAALKTHPQREKMPPCPRLTATNGEATYLSSRGADPERIAAMQRIRDQIEKGGDRNEAV